VTSADLPDRRALRAFLEEVFAGDDPFSEHDWQGTLGGTHFLLEEGGRLLCHAAVVERTLEIADREILVGYVEAVATRADRRHRGYGTTVMRAVGAFLEERYHLGALCTGTHAFYEPLGWERWQGRTFVREEGERRRTAEEDGAIMVLRTSTSPVLDPRGDISCDWRPGDVW
jgi:aminoglycoside 2'-N-acetyltransferase I